MSWPRSEMTISIFCLLRLDDDAAGFRVERQASLAFLRPDLGRHVLSRFESHSRLDADDNNLGFLGPAPETCRSDRP